MLAQVADVAGAAGTTLAVAVSHALPVWLLLGVALHLANQAARGIGWSAVVRAAAPDERAARRGTVVAAWIAGAGVAGLVTARAGDALRVWLLARRLPGASASLVTGTLIAEGAGELALGVVVTTAALLLGVGPGIGAGGGLLAAGALAALFVLRRRAGRRRAPATAGRTGRARATVQRILAGLNAGWAPLGRPVVYARRVLPWQVASRACRLASLACFLAAFHLPVTPQAVLLVVLAQGAGHLVPLSPAAIGAGATVLAATFAGVTGAAVSTGQVAAFYLGSTVLLTVIGVAMAAAVTAAACLRRPQPDSNTALISPRAPASILGALPACPSSLAFQSASASRSPSAP